MIFLFLLQVSILHAAIPKVVVTIKPIHSLVSSIMEGVGTPIRLVPDSASPHTFQLKPSVLREIQQADLIVWVGPDLELFMIKPLTQTHPAYGLLTLSHIPNLRKLPLRHGRDWGTHSDHDHEGEGMDPHFWLSIENAQQISMYIATQLAEADPEHASQYQANAHKLNQRLDTLKSNLKVTLKDSHDTKFMVYHDAYQYFEKEFNLHAAGSIIINPHVPLSAKALQTIRETIKNNQVQCIFKETEFKDTLIQKRLSDLKVKVAELDPLGVYLPEGPQQYEQMLLALGKSFQDCLAAK